VSEANYEEPNEDAILIAEVRATMLDGETVALLPFKHEEDVRAEVNKFVGDWAKTGFLLKDNFLYPWHRVKAVEVASVQRMTRSQAQPYLDAWTEDTEAQKTFWKTHKRKSKGEGENKD